MEEMCAKQEEFHNYVVDLDNLFVSDDSDDSSFEGFQVLDASHSNVESQFVEMEELSLKKQKTFTDGSFKELTKIFNLFHAEHKQHGRLTHVTIQSILSKLTQKVLQKVALPPFDRDFAKVQVKKDEIGNMILKSYYEEALEAYESKPDGNCLFNSLSISLFGHDSYTHHIRFQTLKFYAENYDQIKSIKGNDFFWTEGIDVSLSNCARLGCLGDVAAIYCASRALRVVIRLIYPPINGFLDDTLMRMPQYFQPVTKHKAEVFLMWSSTEIMHVGNFAPNHFLPLFRNGTDLNRKVVNLRRLKSSFSRFLTNHAPFDSSGNEMRDAIGAVTPTKRRPLEPGKVEPGQILIDSSLTAGVEPYQPISDVKGKIRYVLDFPHIYASIPECSKSDCQFIVLDTDREFDDCCGPWTRVDSRLASRFFDKSNDAFVAPSFWNDTDYELSAERNPLDSNVVIFHELNYIHNDNPDYVRKIFVVDNLCFFQYIGSRDKSLAIRLLPVDYKGVEYTPFHSDIEIIKYVLAFEPKSPFFPLGLKENCQFVVIYENEKECFSDKAGPWARTSRTRCRYFDDDYELVRQANLPDIDKVIKFHSLKFDHKNSSTYHRNISIVNDFVFFQYYGSLPLQ